MKEGGPQSAEARGRGRNRVESCCKMGGKWMKWIKQSKGWEILFVSSGSREKYEQSWTRYKTATLKKKEEQPAVGDGGAGGHEAQSSSGPASQANESAHPGPKQAPKATPKPKTKPVLPPWADSFTTASPRQTTPPFDLDLYMEVFRIGATT